MGGKKIKLRTLKTISKFINKFFFIIIFYNFKWNFKNKWRSKELIKANCVYINKKVKPGYNLDLKIVIGEQDEGCLLIKNFEEDGNFEVIFILNVFSWK